MCRISIRRDGMGEQFPGDLRLFISSHWPPPSSCSVPAGQLLWSLARRALWSTGRSSPGPHWAGRRRRPCWWRGPCWSPGCWTSSNSTTLQVSPSTRGGNAFYNLFSATEQYNYELLIDWLTTQRNHSVKPDFPLWLLTGEKSLSELCIAIQFLLTNIESDRAEQH